MPPSRSRTRPGPDMSFETAARLRLRINGGVCGIDEVGRGPWAGPVCAAAVVLDPARIPEGIDDSKRLSPKRREALHDLIRDSAQVGVGLASVEEIAALNILGATWAAMRRAAAALPAPPSYALIDGNRVPPGLDCPGEGIVTGDARSLSIAAASIVAKVTRDRIMRDLAQKHPGYGWERNMGYGVPEHIAALARLGVTQHHRRSFAPIHKILLEEK